MRICGVYVRIPKWHHSKSLLTFHIPQANVSGYHSVLLAPHRFVVKPAGPGVSSLNSRCIAWPNHWPWSMGLAYFPHTIHVWISTYIWLIIMVNVGKYTIHGLSGFPTFTISSVGFVLPYNKPTKILAT